MDLRSLLVFLDDTPACATRTRLAIRLARAQGCHLVGLAPTGASDVQPGPHGGAPSATCSALALDMLRDDAERAAQRFRDACQTAGIGSHDTVIDEADEATSIVRHAHTCDLVLLTQARSGHPPEQDLVERVALCSARPTLIVPATCRFEHVGNRVLVAWDNGREAARALADALPLLRHSNRVDVVRWRKDRADDDTAVRSQLDTLHRWLRMQGVAACHVYLESAHGPLAETMMRRAAQIDADLIVMGAYGHPRWMQRVMGGATRGMLVDMTTPVLMSH